MLLTAVASSTVILVVLVIVVLLRLLLLAVIVDSIHLFYWRHGIILVNDSESMQLTVTTLLRVEHGGCLMTFGVDG